MLNVKYASLEGVGSGQLGVCPAAMETKVMSQDKTKRHKTEWEPMRLTYVGDVGDIIKNEGGQGKSAVGYDSGDSHKPPGQG